MSRELRRYHPSDSPGTGSALIDYRTPLSSTPEVVQGQRLYSNPFPSPVTSGLSILNQCQVITVPKERACSNTKKDRPIGEVLIIEHENDLAVICSGRLDNSGITCGGLEEGNYLFFLTCLKNREQVI